MAAAQVLSSSDQTDTEHMSAWSVPTKVPNPLKAVERQVWLARYVRGESTFESAPSNGAQALAHFAKEKDGRHALVVFLAFLES